MLEKIQRNIEMAGHKMLGFGGAMLTAAKSTLDISKQQHGQGLGTDQVR